MSYTYAHPRPAVTVDCVVFGLDDGERALKVLLIERGGEPYAGSWALPGGFVQMDETLEAAARRELSEETGVDNPFLEQLFTFGRPDRDPRGRVITVAYYSLVKLSDHRVQAATDASDARWFDASRPPALAFDHADILETAVTRLRGKLRYQPIGFELLPEKFTLSQLQGLYEVILERRLDKRNFRRKILGMDLLIATDEFRRDVAHRAPRLYRFDPARYRRLEEQGFNFEL